jgi:hypothetical protein
VSKPSSPNTKKDASESLKPLSPSGTRSSPSASGAPSLLIYAASSPNPAGASSGPEPAESPWTSPASPRSYGLRAADGCHPGEGSSGPDWKSSCDNTRRSQSRCLTILNLSKPGCTSAGSSRWPSTPKQTRRTSRHFIQMWSLFQLALN